MKDPCAAWYRRMFRLLVPLLTLWPLEGYNAAAGERPGADPREQMVVWEEAYRRQMAPVRSHWRQVVLAIHEGRITDLPAVCPGFKSSILALDRDALLAVADPKIRANIEAALDLLDRAAGKCHRSRYFDLSFQLYKARYLIGVIDQRLLRYR